MADIVLRVFRGTKEGGGTKDFNVPLTEGMVVLDALHYIQAHYDGDLAVRWNCKAAKCGSCSAEVNGKPRLTCKTRIDSLPQGEPITVYPMKTFPLIKDLVTDVSWNYQVNKKIPPFTPARDTLRRTDLLKGEAGVGYCNITKCCTEVCPEDIHITDNGIIPLKERMVDDYFDPVRWVIRKLAGK